MSEPQPSNTAHYARRNADEDRAWAKLYRRAGEPAVAAEVVRQLDADAQAKRWHLALYLHCRHTLRRRKARQLFAQRIRRLVRVAFGALVLKPAAAIRGWLGGGEPFAEIAPGRRSVRPVHELRPMLIEALSPTAATSPAVDVASDDEKVA